MLTVSRRMLLRSAAGAIAAGSLLKSPAVLAQAAKLREHLDGMVKKP